jgi:hypothetical protein
VYGGYFKKAAIRPGISFVQLIGQASAGFVNALIVELTAGAGWPFPCNRLDNEVNSLEDFRLGAFRSRAL